MTRLDKFLALFALAAFLFFLAILVGFVPRLDLIVVVALGVLLAVYDFYLSLRGRHRDDSH
jgi:Ca2+/Na+ antiporter